MAEVTFETPHKSLVGTEVTGPSGAPRGTACLSHVLPPLVVVRAASPVTTQSAEDAQEMPNGLDIAVSRAGIDSAVHTRPPSVVRATAAWNRSGARPTAQQSEPLAQERAPANASGLGAAWAVHTVPPSVVSRKAALVPSATSPIARQWAAEAQSMLTMSSNLAVVYSTRQVAPPFAVAMMAEPLASTAPAQQRAADA